MFYYFIFGNDIAFPKVVGSILGRQPPGERHPSLKLHIMPY